MAPPADRAYGGIPMSERRSERRARLIAAGLELIGTRGYDGTTVKEVCVLAKLSERYFYEHFSDRAALLAGVYEHVVGVVLTATLEAMAAAPAELEANAAAGLDAFLSAFEADPRLAKVQLLEAVGRDTAMERRRREVLRAYADMLAVKSAELVPRDDVTDAERRITALALVGATNELAIEWTLGDLRATRAEIVAHLTRLYVAVATAPPPRPSAS